MLAIMMHLQVRRGNRYKQCLVLWQVVSNHAKSLCLPPILLHTTNPQADVSEGELIDTVYIRVGEAVRHIEKYG